jgi:hypothetical protein
MGEVMAGCDFLEGFVQCEPRVQWVRPDGGTCALIRIFDASDTQMEHF